MNKQDTYVQKVKEILENEGKITSWDAIRRMGNTRLSATIYILRNEYNMPIKMTMKESENGKHYGEYYLAKEAV